MQDSGLKSGTVTTPGFQKFSFLFLGRGGKPLVTVGQNLTLVPDWRNRDITPW